MHRTTILIPEALRARLDDEASKEEISFSELVRQALQKYLLSRKGVTAHDSFLSSRTVFDDEGPEDVSEHHDDYLAGKGAH